ncbi:MAG: hypothetical protein E6G59_05090 [Actinobacteria bacterium]|nr:MAG: hypothetical protein E6G59_05090 [Actinomycetota bacterium]
MKTIVQRVRSVALILTLALVLAACAAAGNTVRSVPNAHGHVAGFWLGLWQGAIAPITFLISLFSNHVNVYEVHNNGNWYNFGFVLGAGIFFGGGAFGKRRKKRR